MITILEFLNILTSKHIIMVIESYAIPLYINEMEPLEVLIVDNKIITINDSVFDRGFVHTAFHFLQELYDNKATNQVFPEFSHQYFNNLELKGAKFSKELCLCGLSPFPYGEGSRYSNCLALNLTIHPKKSPKIVHLSNLAKVENARKFMDKDGALVALITNEILLTAKEAFLLFGNINALKFSLLQFKSNWRSFDPELIRENIRQCHRTQLSDYRLQQQQIQHLNASLFCLDYLIYLSKQLIEQKILPNDILRLNGALVLISLLGIPVVNDFIESCINRLETKLEFLSINEKLLYYLLLNTCQYYFEDEIPFVKNFYAKNSSLLNKLSKELYKQNKILKYDVISWSQIKEQYLK